jgi:hypothetical protein
MSSADQQTETLDALPAGRTIIYSSPASLLCLIGGIAAGYVTVLEYKQGATDQIKYAAIMATTILLLSCGLAISRSLKHLELSLWHLRSVKVTLIVTIIQTVIGIVYAFALYYSGAMSPGFRDALLSLPVILAIITCVLALVCISVLYKHNANSPIFPFCHDDDNRIDHQPHCFYCYCSMGLE